MLSWRSRRIRRVVTSTFTAETIQALIGFDAGAMVRDMLDEVLGDEGLTGEARTPLNANTDCLSLVEHVNSYRVNTTEWRLRGNLASLKEAVMTGELASLTHISEAVNVADGLTKTKPKLKLAIFEGMSGKWSVPVRSKAVAKARPGAWQEDFVKLRNPNSDEC